MEVAVSDAALRQRRDALLVANAVRAANKHVKAELAAMNREDAKRYAADIVLDTRPGVSTQSLPIVGLLMSIPGVGVQKVDRWLHRSRIAHNRRVGQLRADQRERLAVLLNGSTTKGARHGK
jgi:hypothetical protein